MALEDKERELLKQEILTAGIADSESFILEYQTLTDNASRKLREAKNIKVASKVVAESKTEALKSFLERKLLIKRTLEEL